MRRTWGERLYRRGRFGFWRVEKISRGRVTLDGRAAACDEIRDAHQRVPRLRAHRRSLRATSVQETVHRLLQLRAHGQLLSAHLRRALPELHAIGHARAEAEEALTKQRVRRLVVVDRRCHPGNDPDVPFPRELDAGTPDRIELPVVDLAELGEDGLTLLGGGLQGGGEVLDDQSAPTVDQPLNPRQPPHIERSAPEGHPEQLAPSALHPPSYATTRGAALPPTLSAHDLDRCADFAGALPR